MEALNAVGGRPLTDRAVQDVLYDKEVRDRWLANRAAYQAQPSHLSARPS